MTRHRKQNNSGRKRLGSWAKKALENERPFLVQRLEDLYKNRERFRRQIEKAPVYTMTRPDGLQVKVRDLDYVTDRLNEDNERAIDQAQYELSKIEFLLTPPSGRPREPIYDQALRDRENDPSLSIPRLAQKYFPHYFPDRAESARRMMDQGLRRAARKKTPSR